MKQKKKHSSSYTISSWCTYKYVVRTRILSLLTRCTFFLLLQELTSKFAQSSWMERKLNYKYGKYQLKTNWWLELIVIMSSFFFFFIPYIFFHCIIIFFVWKLGNIFQNSKCNLLICAGIQQDKRGFAQSQRPTIGEQWE